MKVAHLVLAHNKPDQLKRLLKSLENEFSRTFVHLDKKCDLKNFSFLTKAPQVKLINNRHCVNWGGFSQVKAIHTSIKQVMESGERFDYINLISGQDYPLKPLNEFHSFLEQHPEKIFMSFYLPGHPWLVEAKKRLSYLHLTDYKFKGSTRLEQLINFFLPGQKFPSEFIFVGHSTWFTLSWESAKYIVEFFRNNDAFINKFKYTWGADEILMQSILYNSPLKHKIINDNLRYIDWSEEKPSPKTLTIADKQVLTTTPCFFGRKFDIEIDTKILTYLDHQINNH